MVLLRFYYVLQYGELHFAFVLNERNSKPEYATVRAATYLHL
jgi:hypothetical protein